MNDCTCTPFKHREAIRRDASGMTVMEIAEALISGEEFGLYDEDAFSDQQWQDAAQYAIDTGDYDELDFMLTEQRRVDRGAYEPDYQMTRRERWA